MRNLHLLSASTLALALAACGPQQTASSQAEPSAAEAAAPAAADLPPSAPIRLASAGVEREPYSYIDDAYDLGDAFADSPPDYAVDYQGSYPMVWRSQGGAYRVVEQAADGERDYYYRAGADQPFLVRDPRYAYAYDGGALVEVYDSAGRPLARDAATGDAAVAAKYLARARQIYAAVTHQQRLAAQAADWQARRGAVLAAQRDWAADQQRNDDWRRWRDQRTHDDQARQQLAALQQERSQRQGSAAQLAVAAGAAMQPRQDRTIDQARAQQARAEAGRGQDEAGRQQATAQSQDRQRQMQADAARPAQAQAQVEARAHPQQAQADGARRHQADAQSHQQADARQPQAQARQLHAEAVRRDAPVPQQQVQVQQAQAEQARRIEAQAHPPQHGPGPGSGPGAGDKHGPPKPDRDKDHKPPG